MPNDIFTLTNSVNSSIADSSNITAAELRAALIAMLGANVNRFETAEQPIVSDLNFNNNYLVDVANLVDIEIVFASESTAAQAPTAEDDPLQVEFGPAQGTGGDPMQLAVDGTITINEPSHYWILLELNTDGSTGTLLGRLLVNDVQVGAPYSIMTPTDVGHTTTIILPMLPYAISDTIKFEIVRDTDGQNQGGLASFTSSTGWGTIPSSRIIVSTNVIANEVV